MHGALAKELAQAKAKAGLLQNQFACHKFHLDGAKYSILGHEVRKHIFYY